jgi:hypothetical protein
LVTIEMGQYLSSLPALKVHRRGRESWNEDHKSLAGLSLSLPLHHLLYSSAFCTERFGREEGGRRREKRERRGGRRSEGGGMLE